MNDCGIIIKDVKVPHTTYRSTSGLIIYSMPVDIPISDDLIGALRDLNRGYLDRFDKDNKFSVCVRGDERNSCLISSPEHRMGLRLFGESGKLYVPSNLPGRGLYLLNELTHVFAVRPAKRETCSMEETKDVESGLSKKAIVDIEEAIRQAEIRIGIPQEIINFLEETVGNV